MFLKRIGALFVVISLTCQAQSAGDSLNDSWNSVKNFFTCEDASGEQKAGAADPTDKQKCQNRRNQLFVAGGVTLGIAALGVFLFFAVRKNWLKGLSEPGSDAPRL